MQIKDLAQDALRTRFDLRMGLEASHDVIEIAFKQVRVSVQSHGGGAMTELVLERLHIRACGSHQRRACVAKVVRRDAVQVGSSPEARRIPEGPASV